jgi:hypothetical protein
LSAFTERRLRDVISARAAAAVRFFIVTAYGSVLLSPILACVSSQAERLSKCDAKCVKQTGWLNRLAAWYSARGVYKAIK